MAPYAKNNKLYATLRACFGKEISEYLLRVIPPSKKFDELKYKIPYVLKLNSNKQKFIYFGIDHSKEPSDAESSRMERLFEEFTNSRTNEPVLALESLKKQEENVMAESSQKRGQEKIFHIARNSDMKIICPEVLSKDISAMILKTKKFSPVQIASWIFVNFLWGISSVKNSKNSVQKVKTLLSQLKKDFGINSIDNINQELSKSTDLNIQFPLETEEINLDILDKEILRKIQSPFQNHGVMNEIGIEMNYIRELFITANLLNVLLKGKDLFAVYGANHVVSQEPAFIKYFNES